MTRKMKFTCWALGHKILLVALLFLIVAQVAGTPTQLPAFAVPGSNWYSGIDVPAVEIGSSGDFYLRNSTGDIYQKSGGVWVWKLEMVGIAATLDVNATFTGLPNTGAFVTNIGTNHVALFDFTIPQGIQGPQGDANMTAGPAGAAATVTINATFAGAPGSNASVVNIGDSYNAVFDITIPKGLQGMQGIPGLDNMTANMTASNLDTSWNDSYVLLSGRSKGQSIQGGHNNGENLSLNATQNNGGFVKVSPILSISNARIVDINNNPNGQILIGNLSEGLGYGGIGLYGELNDNYTLATNQHYIGNSIGRDLVLNHPLSSAFFISMGGSKSIIPQLAILCSNYTGINTGNPNSRLHVVDNTTQITALKVESAGYGLSIINTTAPIVYTDRTAFSISSDGAVNGPSLGNIFKILWSSGFVGVNQTSPLAQVDIVGNLRTKALDTNWASGLRMIQSANATSWDLLPAFGDLNIGTGGVTIAKFQSTNFQITDGSTPSAYFPRLSTERSYFLSNVSIGQTTGDAKFNLNGNGTVNRIIAQSDLVNKSYAGNHGVATAITNGATINHLMGITPSGCQLQPTVANTTMAVTALSSTTLTVSSWKTNLTGSAGISQSVYWECWQ